MSRASCCRAPSGRLGGGVLPGASVDHPLTSPYQTILRYMLEMILVCVGIGREDSDHTARSLRLFFLTLSSPSFLRLSRLAIPFSSGGAASAPGTGPERASCLTRFGRGLINVCGQCTGRFSMRLDVGTEQANGYTHDRMD